MKFWKLTLILLLIGSFAACAPNFEPTTPLQQEKATPTAEAPPEEEEVEEEPSATPDSSDTDTDTDTEEPAADEGIDPPPEEPIGDEASEPDFFINAEEGGVVSLVGQVEYTNPFFTAGVAQPLVILEDQAGFVDRDENFLMPLASQTLGQITSDFYTSPFSYSIALPIQPQGTYRDVDNDAEVEQGVQIFAVAYWDNTFGDPFLEERDLGGGGWSTAYASTRISEEYETEREIVGGKLLLYAADETQSFPINFGEDGLLFSDDDADMVDLPQGYTVVDLDTVPFTFDRASNQVIDLVEPTGSALIDYSDLSYTEAFDAFVETLSNEYAFTEYKNIDWEAFIEEYRPLMEEADENGDVELYRVALRDMLWQIPDGHVNGPFIVPEFQEQTAGGLGMAIRDVDDGRVIVNFLLEGGPAAEAGVQLGAEIVAINGVTATVAISDAVAFSAPFSTEHVERLQQLRYAIRFPPNSEVSLTYINPTTATITPTADIVATETVTLAVVPEFDSFLFSSFSQGTTGFELPVEYEILPSGYALVRITSFFDNKVLTIQLWERLMQDLNDNGVEGLIIDMRQNGGGFGFLADQMAAYFYDEPLTLGNTAFYDESLDEFVLDPDNADVFYLPAEELRYSGEVVVLVGPACASACEFFSYDMTLNGRATIVGHYPTAGLGGSVNDLDMPEGERIRYTIGRAVDADGNIHIEGIGVVPDVRVPVTPETLFSTGDPVLETAVALLAGEPAEEEDGSDELETDSEEQVSLALPLQFGEVVTGVITDGLRIQYAISLTEGTLVNIYANATADSELDPYIRLYDLDGNPLLENDDIAEKDLNAGFEELEIPSDVVLIIEVGGFGDTSSGEFTLVVEDATSE